jgi:60 kDa SS-A/Ro ribonucleoprotein
MASVNAATRRIGPKVHTAPGAPAATINKALQLQRLLNACMLWEDNFYIDGESVAAAIQNLVHDTPAEKCATLAIKARNEQKLRHAPLLVVREMARASKAHKVLVADTLFAVIQRPDEITEFLAIYWKDGKETISAQVKKGLARAFNKFSEYQLAKYNRDKDIKLRDVAFLVHAKPKDKEQGALLAKLVNKDRLPVKTKGGFAVANKYKKLAKDFEGLATPDTWEVALSGGADKKETFTRMLEEGTLGALAVIRNLRNMIQAGVSNEVIKTGLATMSTERVLPFRFITAAKYAPQFETELEAAMFRCLAGAPKLGGKTAVVIDVSGSMGGKVSGKSELGRIDAAACIAMLLREVCDDISVYCTAGNDYTEVHKTELIPARRGFALRDLINQSKDRLGGGGIFLTQVMDYVRKHEQGEVERIIVITDEQDCERSNPARVASKANTFGKWNFLINIANEKNGVGYRKWTHVDGFSENVIDYIFAEEGRASDSVDEPLN